MKNFVENIMLSINGMIFGFIGLTNADLMLAIILKSISIVSFVLLIIINFEDAENKLKKLIKRFWK